MLPVSGWSNSKFRRAITTEGQRIERQAPSARSTLRPLIGTSHQADIVLEDIDYWLKPTLLFFAPESFTDNYY